MENSFFIALMMLFFILLFLGSGVRIFAGMTLVGIAGLYFLQDRNFASIASIMTKRYYGAAGQLELACIPLFVWMGELIHRTDLSARLFKGLAPLTSKLPGRLLHTNIMGSALFAAVSGSSAATTATIAKITVPELLSRGYDRSLTLGSIAGAGTFGLMIPPSIIFIIYGVLSSTPIHKLFIAGIIPGLTLVTLYSLYIVTICTIYPEKAPYVEQKITVRDYLNSLILISPILILVVVIMGSIYAGIATPTEAAAVGMLATLIITAVLKQLNMKLIIESLMGAIRLTSLICSLIIASAFLSTAVGYLHIPMDLSAAIAKLHLNPYTLLVVLGIFYVILGFFLEGTSITVMSLPICLPLVLDAGFSSIWFGVYLVIMVEMAQITPPVGFNLFLLQGITGTPIGKIAYAVMPFFILMLIMVVIIAVFPGLATWLPEYVFG